MNERCTDHEKKETKRKTFIAYGVLCLTMHPRQYFSQAGSQRLPAYTLVSTEVRVIGSVMLAVEAGAALGLPSCNALPALALALEMGLEASLLNKFLASVVIQIEREKNNKHTSTEKQLALGTICLGIRQELLIRQICLNLHGEITVLEVTVLAT